MESRFSTEIKVLQTKIAEVQLKYENEKKQSSLFKDKIKVTWKINM